MEKTLADPCRWAPFAIAAAALALGCLVYASDRPQASAWLLPTGWAHAAGAGRWFGAVGDWLPSFVHAFAFSLVSAVCLPASRASRWAACLAWWCIDSAFEIGQHRRWSGVIAAGLPEGWQQWPVLDHVGRYLTRGTFDPADLAAIAFGCLAALATASAWAPRTDKPPTSATTGAST